MTVTVVIVALFVLLAVGIPVAFAMAVSGAIGLYIFGGMTVLTGVLKTSPLSSANSYEIITIPMFILMADESVSQLLIAGLVPGLLVTLTIATTVYVLCLIDPRRAPPGRS